MEIDDDLAVVQASHEAEHGNRRPAGWIDYRCYKDYLVFVLDAWKSDSAGILARLCFPYNESLSSSDPLALLYKTV